MQCIMYTYFMTAVRLLCNDFTTSSLLFSKPVLKNVFAVRTLFLGRSAVELASTVRQYFRRSTEPLCHIL